MSTIKLNYLKCIIPEDYGKDGDEPSLKIVIDGRDPFRIRVAKNIKKGETIWLNDKFDFESYIQIEVWDLDKGTWYDGHDYINKVKITPYANSGESTCTLSGDGAKYELSFTLETPFSESSESSEKRIKKILEHFANKPEMSSRVWRHYSRKQIYLELKARFFRSEISQDEYKILSTWDSSTKILQRFYPYQGKTALCGPAAIAYDLFKSDPITYLTAIISLYEAGECPVKGLYLRPSAKLKRSKRETLPAIDWMLLASMREMRNKLLKELHETSDWRACYTPPRDIVYWLKRIYPGEHIRQRLSVGRIESAKTHKRAILEAFRKRKRSFFLIDAKMITGSSNLLSLSRFHWIVIEPGSVKWAENKKSVKVTFFTWGYKSEKEISMKKLIEHLYVIVMRD